MRPFNCLSLDCPLLGNHLIEASAGTGKTFSIEHIVSRLLLESPDLDIENILCVTFTKAATRDLKKRIQDNLLTALVRLQEKNREWEYLIPHIDSAQAMQRLRDGYSAFDRCQIFTIHGFCYRMLQEFAFEAHMRFSIPDPDLSAKIPQRLLREAQKFLEQKVPQELLCPQQCAVLTQKYDTLKSIALELLKPEQGKQARPFAVLSQCYDALLSSWAGAPLLEKNLLEDFAHIAQNYKAKEGDYLSQVRSFALRDFPLLLQGKKALFSFLDPANKKVREKPLSHLHYPDFFTWALPRFAPLVQEALHPVQIMNCLRAEWKKVENMLRSQEGWLDPDAILLEMRTASSKTAFARSIREKYKAVIIDEFQDTDPLQWEIFQKLFLEQKDPLTAFYLVGDPKQSIYRFRKADVYTYLQARSSLQHTDLFRLDTNYRSSPDLVHSLNALFSHEWLHLPKLQQTLSHPPVKVGKPSLEPIQDGKGAIHFLLAENDPFEETFLPYAALEIEKLHALQNPFHSMAILVKDRYQAAAALRLLHSRSIPAITKSHTLLKDTAAFLLLKELFSSFANPQDLNAMRLVATGAFAPLCTQENRLLLEEGRFLPFCRQLLQHIRYHVPAEIQKDAKQLLEELLLWEDKEGFSFQGIVQFFESIENLSPEEGGQRWMETNPNAVHIITLHASKGLEFTIVFALGLAAAQPEADDEEEEFAAEKLRQLYVAFTRAQKRLYVPFLCGDNKKLLSSPMGLFSSTLEKCNGPFLSFLEKISKTHSITYEKLSSPFLLPPPTLLPLHKEEKTAPYAPLSIAPCFLHSFTSLSQKHSNAPFSTPPSSTDIPRGTETGILIHSIFEHIFSSSFPIWQNPSSVRALIGKMLKASFLEFWQSAIQDMVCSTLQLPLLNTFSLSQLKPHSVQPEIEFLFFTSPHYVKGFIDLIFLHNNTLYFVDWKTNWLGENPALHPHVHDAMTHHDYWLQASLYTEGLSRYVQQLSSPVLFGGAFYLFVRHALVCHILPPAGAP